jgi:exosome complex RNA-binding protein Csl4
MSNPDLDKLLADEAAKVAAMTDNPVARWNAHNPQQTYHYIGKDGQPVLARVLEDQRDAALARIAELEAELETALEERGILLARIEAQESTNADLLRALQGQKTALKGGA